MPPCLKLFYWTGCETTKEYRHGYILVMAPDIETARRLAVEDVKAGKHEWLGADNPVDMKDRANRHDAETYDVDAWHDFLDLLDKDLAREPKVFDNLTSIFINGGE